MVRAVLPAALLPAALLLAALLLAALLLAGCTVPAAHTPIAGGRAALTETGRGVVVLGLTPTGLTGECVIGVGREATGTISHQIRMGWAGPSTPTLWGSQSLHAGFWEVYQIRCGDEGLDRLDGPRGLSPTATRYRPMAGFTLGRGEALYLGTIVLRTAGAFSRTETVIERAGARAVMADLHPEFPGAMQVRPLG